ncbi:hypothetical protein RDn1_081 [Candidatus Termititenax dinenymphae]|uniref:HipA-like C-terminal domain-containing protein n=1 Tax=Candidatus Termititenax dinenymphae TaxID=2218523 RepID=A0A388TK31_9BACT|nr:hypothetical protein RDn1_081 [Candidatus Termititenax dinenymphae]
MSISDIRIQRPDEIVDVSIWSVDDEYGKMYPKGARDKKVVFLSESSDYKFLGVESRRYLYKLSFNRYPDQYWVEIVAYRIGCLMNVPVPPAFVAIDSKENNCGALIEWFYKDIKNEYRESYTDGSSFMKHEIPNFDTVKGTQHNFETILSFEDKIENWVQDWTRIFIFDALIGNTDRHQDNWGTILRDYFKVTTVDDFKNETLVGIKFSQRRFLAPAFDNGTSMGHEIVEEKFRNFTTDDQLNKYIDKGLYHMKWAYADKEKLPIMEFIKKFIARFPEQRDLMRKCISFDIKDAEALVMDLTRFEVKDKLSESRARFMLRLLEQRQKRLLKILEEK